MKKILILMFLIIMTACTKPKPLSILFFGDSITELGVNPDGYVTLIQTMLNNQFPKRNINVIGAGISGHKVSDLEARLKNDVLLKKPDIVVIYIGINDVWHSILPGHTGTSAEDFEAGLHQIIKQIKAIGSDVVLCSPSVIGEKNDNRNPLDEQLDKYAQISRNVAREENIILIDLRKEFKSYLSVNNPANVEKGILTDDGVHLSDKGNKFVADMMIRQLIVLIR